jgi:hypothetical protein
LCLENEKLRDIYSSVGMVERGQQMCLIHGPSKNKILADMRWLGDPLNNKQMGAQFRKVKLDSMKKLLG